MSQSVSIVPQAQQVGDGALDPDFWDNTDFMSQVPVLEATPQPPRNEAEFEWQRENGSTADDAGGNTFGPNITGVTPTPAATSIRITFTTDTPSVGQVVVRLQSNGTLIDSQTEFMAGTSHDMTVSGLTAATAYSVTVGARETSGQFASNPPVTVTTTAAP